MLGVEILSAHTYTMRELNQRTAEVIKEINDSGMPAAITRRGRFVALITPLANEHVESMVLGAVLSAAENAQQLTGESTATGAYTAEDVAEELSLDDQ